MISRGRRVSGMPATENPFSRWQVIQMKCHSWTLGLGCATNVLRLLPEAKRAISIMGTVVKTSHASFAMYDYHVPQNRGKRRH